MLKDYGFCHEKLSLGKVKLKQMQPAVYHRQYVTGEVASRAELFEGRLEA